MRKMSVILVLSLAFVSTPISTSFAAQEDTAPTAKEVESLVHNASNGDANAQFRLARAYETGRGTRQNYSEAARWYMLSANQGFAHAQFNLALLYEEGRGVKKDIAYALSWYEEAARNGLRVALDRLQSMTRQ